MKLPYHEVDYDRSLTLCDLLEPFRDCDTPAIIFRGERISYRQMHRFSDAVAFWLKEHGFGPGDKICVDMARSERYIYAIYGIHKAGACCVPFESTWPEGRKELIYQSAAPSCTITDRLFTQILSGGLPSSAFRSCARAADPAYLMFTSGSTGRPKGVYTTHDNMIQGRYPLGYNIAQNKLREKNLAVINYSSFAVMMTAANLAHQILGIPIVLCDETEAADPGRFAHVLNDCGPSNLLIYTVTLQAYMQDMRFRSALKNVHLLIISGQLSEPLELELRQYLPPDSTILFGYGMSEVGGVTSGIYHPGDPYNLVGTPVLNTLVVLLDEDGVDVEPGEVGEICIGGMRAASYYESGNLKEVKTIDHPEYGRLFRSGDLGTADGEGNLYYKGRIDRMVKIRAHRVELGEIEKVMESCSGIVTAAAAAKGEGYDRYLVGYYTAEQPVDPATVRAHLEKLLPAHYIPPFLMQLDAFPLTTSKKISYPELPDPEIGSGIPYIPAKTEQEKLLASILCQLLNTEQTKVSMAARFAQLGGDSVRAMIAAARLLDAGWRLEPRVLFSDLSLSQVAGKLQPDTEESELQNGFFAKSIPDKVMTQIAQLVGGADNIEEILLGTQEHYHYYFIQKTQGKYWDFTIFNLQLAEVSYTEERFRERVEDIVRCHPALRSIFYETELSVLYQVIPKESAPSLFYRDIRYLSDGGPVPSKQQQNFYSMYLNAYYSDTADIRKRTIPHFVCFRLSDTQCAVGFVCTHMLIDGTSRRILFQELRMTEHPSQTDNYLPLMRARGRQDRSADIAYWREKLDGVKLGEQLILADQSWVDAPMKDLQIDLDPELSEQLGRYWGPRGISSTVLMYHLLGQLLCDLFERAEIVLNLAVTGRGTTVRREDRIIGCLAKEIPVRSRKGMTPEEFRDDLAEAEQHMSLGLPGIHRLIGAVGNYLYINVSTMIMPGLPETGRQLYGRYEQFHSPHIFTVIATEKGSQLGLNLIFNSCAFADPAKERLEAMLNEMAAGLL